jgi:hypothetical protein
MPVSALTSLRSEASMAPSFGEMVEDQGADDLVAASTRWPTGQVCLSLMLPLCTVVRRMCLSKFNCSFAHVNGLPF